MRKLFIVLLLIAGVAVVGFHAFASEVILDVPIVEVEATPTFDLSGLEFVGGGGAGGAVGGGGGARIDVAQY